MPNTYALSEKDARLIKRYCVCPQLGFVSLVMPFVLGALVILGEMIGDLVFYGEGDFRFLGLYAYIAFVIVFCVLFCYGALVPKFGMQGKRWTAWLNNCACSKQQKTVRQRPRPPLGSARPEVF